MYVNCASLTHCLWPCWLTCFGPWIRNHDVGRGFYWTSVICLRLICFCYLSREEHAPCHHESQNKKMFTAELDHMQPIPAASSWTTADQHDSRSWALQSFIQQRYVGKSWIIKCSLNGCLVYSIHAQEKPDFSCVVGDQGTGYHLEVGESCICPRKKEQRKQRVSEEKCYRLLELGGSLKGQQQLGYTKGNV